MALSHPISARYCDIDGRQVVEDTAGYIDQTQRILSTLATIGRLPMSAAKTGMPMMRLASADIVFCFGVSAQFFASAQPVKPSEIQRREKYLTNFLRGRGFCGSRPASGVPEICTATLGSGMLRQNPALVRAKCRVMNTNCNLGINVNLPTGSLCFRGFSNIAHPHQRLAIRPSARMQTTWGKWAAVIFRWGQ